MYEDREDPKNHSPVLVKSSSSRKEKSSRTGRSGIAELALEDEGFLQPDSTHKVCTSSKLFSSYYKEWGLEPPASSYHFCRMLLYITEVQKHVHITPQFAKGVHWRAKWLYSAVWKIRACKIPNQRTGQVSELDVFFCKLILIQQSVHLTAYLFKKINIAKA